MATTVDGKTMRKRWRYPWDLYADGRYWKLRRGVDFDEMSCIRQAGYNYAKRHRITITTEVLDDDTLGIQALL